MGPSFVATAGQDRYQTGKRFVKRRTTTTGDVHRSSAARATICVTFTVSSYIRPRVTASAMTAMSGARMSGIPKPTDNHQPFEPISDGMNSRFTMRAILLTVIGNGGEGQNRTVDTTIFSRMLYQLSYLAPGGDEDHSIRVGKLASG